MRVIAWKRLREFAERHPDAFIPLRVWTRLMETSDFGAPADLKRVFGSVDFLPGNVAVFDVGGNKYRLVVKIEYRKRLAFIRAVMTHAEYDRWNRAGQPERP